MASEIGVNGNYAPHQGYGSLDQTQAGYGSAAVNSHAGYAQSSYSGHGPASQSNSSSAADIPKDEVGWYFVEQYYTTLSKSPEKLFLYYNKRSQFVSGNETEKVAVSVGQRPINDRIKELDFQDCKVRVTNVDSQASDQNIVIQVIGEISNKSAPHKKFTQTFVLAQQTNGYFVLNDIFRYIVEEEDEVAAEEEQQAVQPTGQEDSAPALSESAVPETLTSSSDPDLVERDAAKLDQELEEKVIGEEQTKEEPVVAEPTVNGAAHEEELTESEPTAVETVEETPDAATEEPTTAAAVETEKPKDPEPTPIMSPAKPAPAQTAAPAAAAQPAPVSSKPAAPKTWANLAAAAHRVVTPAVPVVPQPSSSAAQPKTAPATAAPTPAVSSPKAAPAERDPSPAASHQDEWTSVGADHKRQQSKAQAAAGAQETPQHRAYIKNVNDSVDAKELRAEMEKFGEIVYFDVARQKNCAFVDFKTAEGYKAAMDANPHQFGSERLVVEERRMKPGSYPYVQRGGMRGGRGGSSGQGNGRGSFQGPRGGFSQRGRGNNSTSQARGRGGAQAA